MTDDATQKIDNYRDTLTSLVSDAFEVRNSLRDDVAAQEHETPETLYDTLRLARKVVDRLEALYVRAVLVKAQTEKLKAQALADVEDAEILHLKKTRFDDFTSGRERGIEVNAGTLTQRRFLRKVAELDTDAYSVIESVRTMHKGADSTRRDVDTRLRAITLKTTLER